MTRAKTILSWSGLLGFALALRLGLAFGSPNIFFPDEIFQTLEPAHRLVYGYGVISWEWRLGIRSWVLPTFLAGVMRATAWLGSGSTGYRVGTTVVLSLISLTAVWFGYAWARRASGTPAAFVAALACSVYFGLVYFAPKALTEVVAAHLLLPGLYLGMYGDRIGERKRLFFAALFCTLAACLRIQILPAVLFALLFFCRIRWRQRIPAAAAGAAFPVLLFGAADWITWSTPWHSFFGYYKANAIEGISQQFGTHPWYWYGLILIVLVGPALLFLFHGVRRSPFLAIFCAIVILTHSLIPHKEIRFIYPILAPAIVMAAMGAVDLLAELAHGIKILGNPRWIVALSMSFFLFSSLMLSVLCRDWCRTSWGIGAFDRLSGNANLCGVGIYERYWWESGGYTHLHRNVPILQLNSAGELDHDAPYFNALIAPERASGLPTAFAQEQCWKGVCLLERAGPCAVPPPDQVLNEFLKKPGL